jgi:hypothetical protein
LAKAAGSPGHVRDDEAMFVHGAFDVPGISVTIARDAHAAPTRDAPRASHASENRSEAADASADPDC